MAAFEEASLAPRGVAKGLTVSAFCPLLMGGGGASVSWALLAYSGLSGLEWLYSLKSACVFPDTSLSVIQSVGAVGLDSLRGAVSPWSIQQVLLVVQCGPIHQAGDCFQEAGSKKLLFTAAYKVCDVIYY